MPNASDNGAALRSQLVPWPSGDAAAAALRLYKKATSSSPADRYPGMRDICDEIYEMLVLCEADPEDEVPVERMIRELLFGLVGVPEEDHDPSVFRSLARRTQVHVTLGNQSLRTLSLRFRLERLGPLTMIGLDHETARRRLNMRLDETLRDFPNITRKSGHSGSFETHLELSELPRTMRGVEKARRIISRAIEAIERD